MQTYAANGTKYAIIMASTCKICTKYAYMQKNYAYNMNKICRICMSLCNGIIIPYCAYICIPHFADGAAFNLSFP